MDQAPVSPKPQNPMCNNLLDNKSMFDIDGLSKMIPRNRIQIVSFSLEEGYELRERAVRTFFLAVD